MWAADWILDKFGGIGFGELEMGWFRQWVKLFQGKESENKVQGAFTKLRRNCCLAAFPELRLPAGWRGIRDQEEEESSSETRD